MTAVALGEVVQKVDKTDPARVFADSDFAYIDIGAIDQAHKTMGDVDRVAGFDAPSRARQVVAAGDVLVSTVRPNLNAVAEVPPTLDGAIASTGFTVLRPRSDRLLGRYLYHWVRSPAFVADMTRKATGASYPAVSDAIVMRSSLPLPPIEEQRRIAAVLDQADEARAKRRASLTLIDSLTESIFLDMFGSIDVGARMPLGDLFDEPPLFGSMIPPSGNGRWLALRVGNIQRDRLDLSDRKWVDLSPKDVRRHTVQEGDLLMARAIASEAHLGKCVVVLPGVEDWAFDSHLMRLRLDRGRLRPEFLKQWLSTVAGRAAFLRVARRSSVQFNVNTKEIARLPVPTPPIEDQLRFTTALASIEEHRSLLGRSDGELDRLFDSLQQRAFAGAL